MRKAIAIYLLLSFLSELFLPTVAFALTSGPNQPEMASFAPVSMDNMVDLSSGDFKYNIPLLEIGEYPINLVYDGGPTMDQEAGWVGLGWTLNPGSINRQVRGLPDDAYQSQEKVVTNTAMRPNETWGVNVGIEPEMFGLSLSKKIGGEGRMSLGISRNTFKGYNASFGVSAGLNAGQSSKSNLTGSLGLAIGGQDGAEFSASVGIKKKDDVERSATIGSSFNTREGMKSISFAASCSQEKSKVTYGASSNASLSLNPIAYPPSPSSPMHTDAFTFNVKLGADAFGFFSGSTLSGYYSKSGPQAAPLISEPVGYLQLEKAGNSQNALLDYSREKDIEYVRGIPNLPPACLTPDQFSISGQGVGGQFRAYRSDVGVIRDRRTLSTSNSTTAGVEVGFTTSVHIGADIKCVLAETRNSGWIDDNEINESLRYCTPDYLDGKESVNFKCTDDKSLPDSSVLLKTGGYELASVELEGRKSRARNVLNVGRDANRPVRRHSITGILRKPKREKRAQSVSYLTNSQSEQYGFTPWIQQYPMNQVVFSEECGEIINRYSASKTWISSSQYIGEINVRTTEGKEFIYGQPVYNRKSKDVSFSVSEQSPLDALVHYDAGDNSKSNSKGMDQYFYSKTEPEYASSFLLSYVLSPDYVDRTGNGVTNDDLGTWTKFNYSRLNNAYRWRAPFGKDTANYNPGINTGNGAPTSSYGDAKGNYSYGSKDLNYVHSIESQTMLAQFYLEERLDGLGVTDENGGLDPNSKQYLLREIRLFSKSDLIAHGASHAVPIKTVHFVYDYSVCPRVENNLNMHQAATVDNSNGHLPYYVQDVINSQAGKLTLRKVYFTYGRNYTGSLNPYVFNYSENNPDYAYRKADRWSNYKDNSLSGNYSHLTEGEYPYVIQDTSVTNEFARAWQLTEIQLPTGGKIRVQYEADDYAYVQDRPAGQMYMVRGFGPDPGTCKNELYNTAGDQYPYVFFDVPSTIGDLEQTYLRGQQYIAFRVSCKLTANSNYEENIWGYAEVDRSGQAIGAVSSTRIWVRLKLVDGKNPVVKQALQFLRSNAPEAAYGYNANPNTSVIDAIRSLVGSIGDVLTWMRSFESKAIGQNSARWISTSKSWARLNNWNGRKLGGGYRVASISLSDEWNAMTSSATQTYSEFYDYSMVDTDGRVISSGVASWEPSLGGEENSHRTPKFYKRRRALGPDDYLFQESPLCESLYPAPSIVYRRVTKTSGVPLAAGNLPAGFQVSEFYTAYDFPVIVDNTTINHKQSPKALGFLKRLFKVMVNDYCTTSQGYKIVTNDMHGKQKSEAAYSSSGSLIAKTTYRYRQSTTPEGKPILDNKVAVMDARGQIKEAEIGRHYDFWVDMREHTTEIVEAGVQANSELLFFVILPPLPVTPLPFPLMAKEVSRFRSAVTVKSIALCGLLDQTEVIKDGSRAVTSNLLYDGGSGSVVLTSTQNAFEAPVYDFKFPAYYGYPQMGAVAFNVNFQLPAVQIRDGRLFNVSPLTRRIIEVGDEYQVFSSYSHLNGLRIHQVPYQGDYRFIDSQGELVTFRDPSGSTYVAAHCVLVRSGRKNNLSAIAGTVQSLENPINAGTSRLEFSASNTPHILQASATEYSDKWKVPCIKGQVEECDTTRPAICLEEIYNQMILYQARTGINAFEATRDDSISLADLMGHCNCACQLDSLNGIPATEFFIYALSPATFLGGLVYYTYQFGPSCQLIMTAEGNIPINMNNWVPASTPYTQDSCIDINNGINKVELCIQCLSCETTCKQDLTYGLPVNPYRIGLYGRWYPEKEWKYRTQREPNGGSSRNAADGYFTASMVPFWEPDTTHGYFVPSGKLTDPNWIMSNRITRVNRLGADIENANALEIPSAALYGYSEQLPIAVSANSRLQQIGNDNFEDYDFSVSCNNPCLETHMSFKSALQLSAATIDANVSHTGLRSLHIPAEMSVRFERELYAYPDTELVIEDSNKVYMKNGCLEKFSPTPGQYHFSAWIRPDAGCQSLDTSYGGPRVSILFPGDGRSASHQAKGRIIDGWQRIDFDFEVPAAADSIVVILSAGISSAVWFDDVRIHPTQASMKTYVYHPFTQRLMAELDDNNYAIFYEYSDEGKLIRIKRETDFGVVTQKEGRTILKR